MESDWIDMKKGRPKKRDSYDAGRVMKRWMDCIVDAYSWEKGEHAGSSLRKVSEQFGISLMKTRKILITAEAYHSELSEQIGRMSKDGMSISAIMKETGLSRSSVHSYLPYSKIIYNADELSLYAERCRTYRERKCAVKQLQLCKETTLEKLEMQLWNTIVLFSGYFFTTAAGERFRYTIDGDAMKISRKGTKITRRDVKKALRAVVDMEKVTSAPPNSKGHRFDYLDAVFMRLGLPLCRKI